LLAAHPKLAVELIFREYASNLIEDGIDVEVRLGPVADSSLMCRRLGWTTAFLVAAPAYVASRPPPSTPEDVAGHECICYSRAGDSRTWLFSNGSDDLPVRIAPRLTVDNAIAVHRAALAGAGLAILSHIIAVPEIAAGRLIQLMPDFPPARLPITAVYPSRRNIPLRVTTVLDFLAEIIHQDPAMSSADSGQ